MANDAERVRGILPLILIFQGLEAPDTGGQKEGEGELWGEGLCKPFGWGGLVSCDWQGITDLQIVAGIHRLPTEPKTILSGGTWPGTRELRNLQWTGGGYTSPLLYPGGKLSAEEFQKIFQDDIDKSIELEKNDADQSEAEGE